MKQPSFYWTVSTILVAIIVAAAVMLFVGCTVNRYVIINVPEQPNILTWEDDYDPGFYHNIPSPDFYDEPLRPLSIDFSDTLESLIIGDSIEWSDFDSSEIANEYSLIGVDTLNCQHPVVMTTSMYCPTSQCNTCTCMNCGKKLKC